MGGYRAKARITVVDLNNQSRRVTETPAAFLLTAQGYARASNIQIFERYLPDKKRS
jgi:hypothetical protein